MNAIRQLDDDTYARREAATDFLWAAGRDAEAALEETAAHGDPEARTRAQRILDKFHYGIYPDTPPEIAELVNRYQVSDANGRLSIIGLLGDKGGYGILVLSRLSIDEADVTLQENIRSVLKARAARAAETAAILIAARQADAAAHLLDDAAVSGDAGVFRASAALAASTGQLPRTIERLKNKAATDSDTARRLAYLYRAGGDLDHAQESAGHSTDARLTEDLLLERHDWTHLATALTRNADGPEDIRRAGLIAAVQRFAGDQAGFTATIARLRVLAKRGDTQTQAVMAFLLNDQVDDALAVYLDRRAYLNAFDVYRYTGRFKDAIALADRAAAENHPDLYKLQVSVARLLWKLGEPEKADKLLASATTRCEKSRDFGLAVFLCEAHKEMGHTDRAHDFAVLALAAAKDGDSFPWLFSKLFPGNESAAQLWWQYLRENSPQSPDGAVLSRLTSLMEHHLAPEEVQGLVAQAHTAAVAIVDKPLHERWLQLLADTLRGAGLREPAEKYLDELSAARQARDAWSAVADRLVDQNQWLRAAECYQRAAIRPANSPEYVWLRGYCLSKGGRAEEGRKIMDEATLLPLADEGRRHSLAEAMTARGLPDEAAAQREMIMRAGLSRGWYFYESAKQLGNDAARRGDYLKASGYWQLFLLQVLDDGGAFVEETAYLDLPQLVHRNRARGLLAHGDVDGAMVELRNCAAVAPAVTQLAIDFVPELDKSGHHAQGDELFALVIGNVKQAYADYPNSAYFHNDLAWACTLCNRKPAEALAHARIAVELAPTDTNGLDTLAEIHFRAGRVAEAEAVMRKCIELEPNQDRHRQRLEGFKAGKGFGEGGGNDK